MRLDKVRFISDHYDIQISSDKIGEIYINSSSHLYSKAENADEITFCECVTEADIYLKGVPEDIIFKMQTYNFCDYIDLICKDENKRFYVLPYRHVEVTQLPGGYSKIKIK